MKLTRKLLKILCFITLICLIILYFFSRSVLLKSFSELESEKAQADTKIVMKYIDNESSDLQALNLDYSKWDDTYNYIFDHNAEYISDNFDDLTSFYSLNVQFIIIADSSGNIIFQRKVNKENESINSSDEKSFKLIATNTINAIQSSPTGNLKGIITVSNIPIIISAEQIVNSDGSKKSNGYFIMGKYFDSSESTSITTSTGFNNILIPYKSDMPDLNSLPRSDTFTTTQSNDIISGFGIIKNVLGKPSYFIKVDITRDIFKKARNSINYYFLILLIVIIISGAAVYIFLNKVIIRRIRCINEFTDKVSSSSDLALKLQTTGNDEITDLGNSFNKMLQRLKESENKILSLAYFDPLTELPNRKMLIENIMGLLNYENHLAILFLDLDNFKNINDSLGHLVGDFILKKIADRLKETLSSEDLIGRIGGDEFVIVLNNISESSDAEAIAANILKTLKPSFKYENNELYLGASIGISLFPHHGKDISELFKNADTAMYAAKNNGGYCFKVFSYDMNKNAIYNLILSSNLKKALENEEFIAFYQPIVDLRLMKAMKAEALIRWRKDNKLIAPAEFIPLAKKIGEIAAIDNWMLLQACTQCKRWHELGLKDFIISVNISYKQLSQDNFEENVLNILFSSGLAPRYLNLEITEDEAMENPELTIKVLKNLKAKGIRISLDDFGTGYSSLSYVGKLPIDTLKIDKSLVSNIEMCSKSCEIIKAIIVMAHSLNIMVVAEGIETISQLNILKELKCDMIQGYWFSKPISAEDFEANYLN